MKHAIAAAYADAIATKTPPGWTASEYRNWLNQRRLIAEQAAEFSAKN